MVGSEEPVIIRALSVTGLLNETSEQLSSGELLKQVAKPPPQRMAINDPIARPVRGMERVVRHGSAQPMSAMGRKQTLVAATIAAMSRASDEDRQLA